MRFNVPALAVTLLTSKVVAHPSSSSTTRSGLSRRTIDLSAFRLKTASTYANATTVVDQDISNLVKRGDYIDTATALVKSTIAGAEFRLVDDQYVTPISSTSHCPIHFGEISHPFLDPPRRTVADNFLQLRQQQWHCPRQLQANRSRLGR